MDSTCQIQCGLMLDGGGYKGKTSFNGSWFPRQKISLILLRHLLVKHLKTCLWCCQNEDDHRCSLSEVYVTSPASLPSSSGIGEWNTLWRLDYILLPLLPPPLSNTLRLRKHSWQTRANVPRCRIALDNNSWRENNRSYFYHHFIKNN